MLAVLETKQDAPRGWFASAGAFRRSGDCGRCSIFVHDDDDFQGCIFVNVAMEFPLQHEHIAAASTSRRSKRSCAEWRLRGCRCGIPMEATYVTRQVTGDRQSIAVARRLAELVIAAHLPAADCAVLGAHAERAS